MREPMTNDVGHHHLEMGHHGEKGGTHRESLQVGKCDESADVVAGDHEAKGMSIRIADEGQDARVGTDQMLLAERLQILADGCLGSNSIPDMRYLENTHDSLVVCPRSQDREKIVSICIVAF